MSIEQTGKVDYVTIANESGDVLLTISDHLPWVEKEDEHLIFLQEKLNTYLRFIESGEMIKEFPHAKGRGVAINVVSKFPLTHQAELFIEKSRAALKEAGIMLQFELKG